MSQAQALSAALDAERSNLVRQINWRFRELDRLVARALDEHAAGNLHEARILLNEALDIECDVTGDCKILGPLSEEWEVDYERDRRKDQP